MLVSPHTHPESPLTGSTLANLIKRAKQLDRTHFAYTDLGHMSSALKAYKLCKADKKSKDPLDHKEIKFIPGIEVYFKDAKFTAGSKADRCKYFTVTLHCQDQEAFQALSKLVSREGRPTILVHQEKQQLWCFKDLEEIAPFKVTLTLGGVHCIVGKPFLAGDPQVSKQTLDELIRIFGKARVYAALVIEPWGKKWTQVVEIRYTDTTSDSLLASDFVTTDKAHRRIRAIDLVERGGHKHLLTCSKGISYYEVNKDILEVKLHKGFLPFPGGDAMVKVNQLLKALAKREGLTVLVSDYAYFAAREDKIVQTMRLEGNDKLHPTFNMKTKADVHAYLGVKLGMSLDEVNAILENNSKWASLFNDLKLDYVWHLADSGGEPLKQVMEIIKQNGRMKWDDPKYVARLREELTVIAKNPVKDLTAYFLPIRDVLNYYRDQGFLTGPGRGSAGGSLLCYCLGITQIDPFDFDLPFQRFFSLDRIMAKELPDIDVDLEDRSPLVGEDNRSGYLYGRWGDKAAQISTRTTIRLKSAIKDVNRYFKGKVEPEIEKLSEGLPTPPQGVNDHSFVFGYEDSDGNHIDGLIEVSEELKKYRDERPEEWAIVSKAMGLTRAYSRHASAYVLSDVSIQDVAPTKEGHITQYEAKEVEAAGLIKYDFLVINQLKDIRVCLDLVNKRRDTANEAVGWWHPESGSGACADCEDPDKAMEKSDGLMMQIPRSMFIDQTPTGRYDEREHMFCFHCKKHFSEAKKLVVGNFYHEEKPTYIWKLPVDPAVYQSIWEGSTETIFQIATRSMTPFVMEMKPSNMMDLATLLALVRPGPMDFVNPDTGRNMVEEYMLLRKGEVEPDIKELADLLPETFGIICFQESLGKIARDLAGFSGPEAETLRANMAKKRLEKLIFMKPKFMEGAIKKISEETAEAIWNRMVTFGRYGFSVIHAVEYAHITYACMFLKKHYPLEWWAAILTNAEEKEITTTLWPYVKDLVAPPDINLSSDRMVVDYVNNKIRAKLGVIRGLGEKTIEPIVSGRPYKDIHDFVNREVAGVALTRKLIHVGVLDSLFPAKLPFLEKLQIFEQAIIDKEYAKKVETRAAEGKEFKGEKKVAVLPEEYLELTPMQEAVMRKAVLPSLPVNFHEMGLQFSKVRSRDLFSPTVISANGHLTPLISGDGLKELDERPTSRVTKDIYVAATCYVAEAKEFPYAKNTKRALKMVLDADGYVSEKVLWPGFDSGELEYPVDLKKGCIATVFFRKKVGRKELSVQSVTVEASVK